MKDQTKELYMYILGAIIVVGFFSIVTYKLSKGDDVQLEIGALLGAFGAVVGYFYGSSKGSSDKTKIMAENGKPQN